MIKLPLISVNRCRKQIVAAVCLTLIGCIYIQQNLFQQRPAYFDFLGDFNGSVCKARSNLVFIKAHKCASSAVQNIFMRYGYFHNKTFVLPSTGNYLGHPLTFQRYLVPSPKTFHGEFNILTHHSRLNYSEMRSLMPTDTLFITIVRNPVKLFESMFTYYKLEKMWNFEFTEFNSENFNIPDNMKNQRFSRRIGINQMMFDMGFEEKYFYDHKRISSYIEELDSIFSLVMVAERMDESLILLKNLLCWTIDDIIVFKVNSRNETSKQNITDIGKSRINKLNMADKMLYDHFVQKFDTQVERFGKERMSQEIKQLQNRTLYYYNLCVGNTFTGTKNLIVRFENQRKDNLVCEFLTRSELSITSFIRNHQLMIKPNSILPNVTKHSTML